MSQGTAGDVDSAIYPCYGYSGDEISLKSMPGIASQHPRYWSHTMCLVSHLLYLVKVAVPGELDEWGGAERGTEKEQEEAGLH